jgi:membrane associated rhomboid family serine protease
MGYGAIELFSGITGMGTNIAHFAHLGGMLFGFFMIRYWNRNTRNFY